MTVAVDGAANTLFLGIRPFDDSDIAVSALASTTWAITWLLSPRR